MHRIFFALALPEQVRQQLADLQKRLEPAAGAVKWVEKDNFHLTLQFIGSVDESRLRQLLRNAEAAAACCTKFTITLAGVGAFPSTAKPRVIWTGVTEGRKELRELVQALNIALDKLPDKPFSPHVTLGRVRPGRVVNFAQTLQAGSSFYTEPIKINSFYCWQSTLTRSGPIYRQLKEFTLL